MVFYVYFDPEVVAVAENGGEYALQCLIGILRGFEANCLLAEFDDFFVQTSIKERLNDLRDDNARKALKSLFAVLDKKNRFVYTLVSQDAPPQTRVADALIQGARAELDIVVTKNPESHPNPHNIPSFNLQAYNTTEFEIERSAVANGGRTFAAASRTENDFLDWTLRKALKNCTVIKIYDKLFGARFRGNYEYSAKVLLAWLEGFVANPDRLRLQIHCGLPEGNTDAFIKHQLSNFRVGRLSQISITVQFYKTAEKFHLTGDHEELPHQRYLITEQIAIDLGRGLDFLDPAMNRDGKFGFATTNELFASLRALPVPSLAPVSC